MFTLDTSTAFGARIARQLADESFAWLTTVTGSGGPAPNPVWFVWNGQELLVLSKPGQAKLRNLARQPKVSLHFNSGADGDSIGILSGSAAVDDQGLSGEERAAYDAKYAGRMAGLGSTPAEFHLEYAVLIRITPDRLRGH